MPRPVWIVVLTVHTAALLILTVLPAGEWRASPRQIGIAAAVCAATLIHAVSSRVAEERRRALHNAESGGSIDTSCVLLFAAAVLLPQPVAAALLVLTRALRWRIARKQPAKFLYSVSSVFAGQALAHAASPTVRAALQRHPAAPSTHLLLTLLAAAVLYFAAQTILIGAVRCLEHAHLAARHFGTGSEHLSFAGTLSAGVLLVCAAPICLWAPLLAAPVTIAATRVLTQLAHLHRERDQLEVDALHDPLTGLFNRRGFHPHAELALTTDAATDAPSAVLMADLDHFKNWNTKLGHIGADAVLRQVADILRAHSRHADILCRWGGEEILIVLPNTPARAAFAWAERLRAAIAAAPIVTTLPSGDHTIVLGTDGWPPVTISIGLALAPDHGRDLTELQEAADQALQQAKDHGRNRVSPAPRRASSVLEPPLP